MSGQALRYGERLWPPGEELATRAHGAAHAARALVHRLKAIVAVNVLLPCDRERLEAALRAATSAEHHMMQLSRDAIIREGARRRGRDNARLSG